MITTEYSKEELAEMISRMKRISTEFYNEARLIGVHPFVEFCGLMSAFIDMCEDSAQAGIDITVASGHFGKPLIAAPHKIEYIAEKFNCIFGPTLQNPVLRNAFLKEMGWTQDEDFEHLKQAAIRSGEGIEKSRIFMALMSKDYKVDPIPALQLGIAILLNKPIAILALDNEPIPEALRKLAFSVETIPDKDLTKSKKALNNIMQAAKDEGLFDH
jgi:hypothetical protein